MVGSMQASNAENIGELVMPCIYTAEEGQSEFDFFIQLKANPALTSCCGPIVVLGFTGNALDSLQEAILTMDLPEDYLDTFNATLLDSEVLLVSMCSRHWMKHSEAIATLGVNYKVEPWVEIAYYIYTYLCITNKWDYKEVANYTRTTKFTN